MKTPPKNWNRNVEVNTLLKHWYRIVERNYPVNRGPVRLSYAVQSRKFPLTYDQFNKFCRALPATTYVNQWGGAHVWKVGGKVFAIGGWVDDEPGFTFKVSHIS